MKYIREDMDAVEQIVNPIQEYSNHLMDTIEVFLLSKNDLILKMAGRLLSSGAIDINSYEGRETELAKILAYAAISEALNTFTLTPEMKKEVYNLQHF